MRHKSLSQKLNIEIHILLLQQLYMIVFLNDSQLLKSFEFNDYFISWTETSRSSSANIFQIPPNGHRGVSLDFNQGDSVHFSSTGIFLCETLQLSIMPQDFVPEIKTAFK